MAGDKGVYGLETPEGTRADTYEGITRPIVCMNEEWCSSEHGSHTRFKFHITSRTLFCTVR